MPQVFEAGLTYFLNFSMSPLAIRMTQLIFLSVEYFCNKLVNGMNTIPKEIEKIFFFRGVNLQSTFFATLIWDLVIVLDKR